MSRKNFFTSIVLSLILFIAYANTTQSAESDQPIQVGITIDASQTKEPISKYIYGQFIEHLGRCIYGGIWAEMLEDRKFYFPVTAEFKPWSARTDRSFWGGGRFPVLTGSPWKVIGGDNVIQMIQEDTFVGEHTPEIRLSGSSPAGIEQGELALQSGKEYVGYVILAGDPDASPIQVSLIWGDGDDARDTYTVEKLVGEYNKFSFTFQAKADTEKGRLQIAGSGKGAFRIGTASLMPADHINGFRPDTLALMKELDSPVYRWPGGNFVSDYNWKDGIGDRDKRPPRKNPAWTGIEPNDVGIHEFMDLCELLDTEPFIAVNTGLGTCELAAEELEYCNSSVETPMGKLRAENGQPEPFNVKWWAVGNEMYGDWQLGHMPLEEYVKKHNLCVELMRKVDPNAQMIAVGHVGEWSRTMMTHSSDHMELISEHIYRKNHEDLAKHVYQLVEDIRRVADAHREYRATVPGLTEKDIRIAMDEWNYWYGPYIYGELGVQYHLQDALGVAAGLHEYFRNSDIYHMANYAQTVNVIGAIKTSKTDAVLDTTGYALKLYRQHYGEIPVDVASDPVSNIPAPLDVAAALTQDRKAMTIAVVNPNQSSIELPLEIRGMSLEQNGQMWLITGDNRMAHNVPGQEPEVQIQEKEVNDSGKLSVPPLSVSLFSFNVK